MEFDPTDLFREMRLESSSVLNISNQENRKSKNRKKSVNYIKDEQVLHARAAQLIFKVTPWPSIFR